MRLLGLRRKKEKGESVKKFQEQKTIHQVKSEKPV